MGSIVQHNLSAMNANRMLSVTTSNQKKSTEKLSSGYRINRAGDDAAGLAISEKMRGQIKGLNRASSNSQDGISMIQTAEGALTETHSIIQRMRELAVQSSSDTNTDDDRTQIQNEIDQLTQEVDRIANTTEFNTKKLLNGDRAGALTEKAGKASVDSSFGNSMVSASITTNGTDKAAFTDVIRVEITKNFTEGQSTKATPKLSSKEIDNIYKLIGGKAASADTTLAPVLQETIPVTLTASGATANDSTAVQIDKALTSAQADLLDQQSLLNVSNAAVSANEANLKKIAEEIYKSAKTVGENTTAGESILKSDVTKEDLENALRDYVGALVSDGATAAGATSNDITEKQKAFEDLFNSDSTDTIKTAVADQNFSKTKKADGTDNNALKVATGDLAANKKIGEEVVSKYITAIETAAKEIAQTQITDKVNAEKVNQIKSVVDTLGDKDLSTAIVNYKNAVADYDTIKATGTDEKKAEYQAKVDEAKAALDKLNTGESVMTVSDLFGTTDDINKFSIGSKVDDAGNLTINMKNKSGDDTVITISNADKLKAGDIITITSEEMVESKQATTGKEAFRLQVGANAGQEVSLGINSMKAKDLNLVQTKDGVEGKALDVTTQAGASMAINAYDMAIQKVSTERAKMGAMQNRLEHTIANLDSAAENAQNAESRIRDTDMASEMVEFSKNNILAQAGQSMLAQANQSNQGVLSLLG